MNYLRIKTPKINKNIQKLKMPLENKIYKQHTTAKLRQPQKQASVDLANVEQSLRQF